MSATDRVLRLFGRLGSFKKIFRAITSAILPVSARGVKSPIRVQDGKFGLAFKFCYCFEPRFGALILQSMLSGSSKVCSIYQKIASDEYFGNISA